MKSISALLFVVLSLFLQGCFDVIEQLKLKDDGSGTFQLVLNMSRSKTKIHSIMKLKKVNDHPVPTKEEIQQKLAELEKMAKNTPGISNVKTKLDLDNFIATINCSFKNVASINNVVKNIAAKESNLQADIDKNYSYDAATKTFNRYNRFQLKSEYEKLSSADREIFATATYTGIFRFDNIINGFTNKESKVAGDKKAVMLKQNTLDIITNKKTIENKITLNK